MSEREIMQNDEKRVLTKQNSANSLYRAKSIRDLDRMRSLGEIHVEDGDLDAMYARHDDAGPSVSSMFKNRIIQRAPDKMIDFLGGCILISYRN